MHERLSREPDWNPTAEGNRGRTPEYRRAESLTDLAGSRSKRQEFASSAIDESSQHVTDAILSAEEHCQDAYGRPFFVNIKPVDCAIDCQMPQSRQNIVVTFASVRRGQNAIGG